MTEIFGPVIVGYSLALCVIAAFMINTFLAYNRLKHIKGPWLASLSRLWLAESTIRRSIYSDLADICKKYGTAPPLIIELVSGTDMYAPGPLARIAPNDLVTNDPEIIRRMGAARSPYSKSQWYAATAISHQIDHIFSETNERRHTERRAMMVAGVR